MSRPQLKLGNLLIRPSLIDNKIHWHTINYYWKNRWIFTSNLNAITWIQKDGTRNHLWFISDIRCILYVRANGEEQTEDTWLGFERGRFYLFGKKIFKLNKCGRDFIHKLGFIY